MISSHIKLLIHYQVAIHNVSYRYSQIEWDNMPPDRHAPNFYQHSGASDYTFDISIWKKVLILHAAYLF
jgi:hypothetical protein